MISLTLLMPMLSLIIFARWYMQFEPMLDARGTPIAVARDARPLLARLFAGIVSFGSITFYRLPYTTVIGRDPSL